MKQQTRVRSLVETPRFRAACFYFPTSNGHHPSGQAIQALQQRKVSTDLDG